MRAVGPGSGRYGGGDRNRSRGGRSGAAACSSGDGRPAQARGLTGKESNGASAPLSCDDKQAASVLTPQPRCPTVKHPSERTE